MRRASVIGCACAAAVLSGCGGGDDPPAPPRERVELQVTAPADVTKFYTIDMQAFAGPPPGFTISAAPTGSQATDQFGTLTLNEKGTKGSAAGTSW
jgi:hypothetical protein